MGNGLSKFQVACIVFLWVGFCVMLFLVPTNASLGENIFIAILSGIFLVVALNKNHQRRRRNRDE